MIMAYRLIGYISVMLQQGVYVGALYKQIHSQNYISRKINALPYNNFFLNVYIASDFDRMKEMLRILVM